MTLLIDADIIAFRCAAVSENEPSEIAVLRTDQMLREILQFDSEYLAFLTGKNNFRYTINPEYKANRKDKPKPIHLQTCREYLIKEYGAIVTDGIEADDALGIHQTADTAICSIDKDLLMIPGHHYNFVKKEYKEVSELDGLKAFYRQMLIGDTSDNVFGVKGIGPVKAGKLIDSCTTEKEMYSIVEDLYGDEQDRFSINADCLWIMRNKGETYSKRYEKISTMD